MAPALILCASTLTATRRMLATFMFDGWRIVDDELQLWGHSKYAPSRKGCVCWFIFYSVGICVLSHIPAKSTFLDGVDVSLRLTIQPRPPLAS